MAIGTSTADEDTWVPSACDMCYNACTIRVRRVHGTAVKVEGIPGVAPNYGKVCAKGNAALMNLYNPNRIGAPLVRTNPEKGIGVDPGWREISWDEAMDLLVSKLRAARQKDPRSAVVVTFDRYSFHLARAFTSAFGSPNLTTASAGFFCGNGVHPVAFTLTGSNDVHPDLHLCNYLLMFGTSYGFVAQMNAMGLTHAMAEARARGMKLVVVDPVCSTAASKADEWVPLRPGTDAAFALALMREWVVERDHYDKEFLRRYTNAAYLISEDGRYVREPASGKPLVVDQRTHVAMAYDAVDWQHAALEGWVEMGGRRARPSFDAFKEHLQPYTLQRAEEITSIPARTIQRIAAEMVEAAGIGRTITLEGATLPFRPAVACWYRGVSGHKHSLLNGMSIGQLNVLLGNVDVPGGLLNAAASGPSWRPQEDPDGLMIPNNPYGGHMHSPLPRRQVKPPETLELIELFPVSVVARAMLWLGLRYPEEFGLPYKAEVLIQCRTNMVAASGDPPAIAEALKSIPFICSMATHHDETTEFADLLLPDQHALERLVPLVHNPYYHYATAAMPYETFTFNFQQPVVKPFGQARYWGEVLLDAAERLGILPDLYATFNRAAQLEGPHQLDPTRTYTWEEIADRWSKALCGDEHGLNYFRQHGYYEGVRRSTAQSYPRAYHEARIPLYLEHFIDAGEAVKAFTEERDIPWDTSDYLPLVEWKPCYREGELPPEYDLWVVNQKLPFMTYTFTGENAWLVELAGRNTKVFTVGINAETARRKGIREGDRIVLETADGRRAEGVARLTQGIHPECLAVPGITGRWARNDRARGQGVHFNSLLRFSLDRFDTVAAALDACVKVRVSRA
ncbi:MAG: molybdopterin-dependent oxidoreductase [Chloroflexi bacterium]|nr:molybdopterin-dependent oxidoreductase [Chloroflexota bacterium]